MSEQDYERMRAAMEKKRRKLERYTSTPAAKARAEEMRREHAACEPMQFPEVSETICEVGSQIAGAADSP